MPKEVAEQKKQTVKKVPRKKRAPVRLWVKSIFLGFRRSRLRQNVNQVLMKIEGVNDKNAANYYFGRRVAYIYKTHKLHQGKKFKVIWGKVCRAHGTNGVVIARFAQNLPSKAMGSILRVMLYPYRAPYMI